MASSADSNINITSSAGHGQHDVNLQSTDKPKVACIDESNMKLPACKRGVMYYDFIQRLRPMYYCTLPLSTLQQSHYRTSVEITAVGSTTASLNIKLLSRGAARGKRFAVLHKHEMSRQRVIVIWPAGNPKDPNALQPPPNSNKKVSEAKHDRKKPSFSWILRQDVSLNVAIFDERTDLFAIPNFTFLLVSPDIKEDPLIFWPFLTENGSW